MFTSSFFGSLYRNSNIIILGFLSNNLNVGYYSISEKIIRFIQNFQYVVGNVLFPFFSQKNFFDKRFFINFNKKYIKKILLIYSLLTAIIFIFADFIIKIVTSVINITTSVNLKIMSFIILISGLNYYLVILGLISMNYKKDFSSFMLITGLVNVIICFFFVYLLPSYGASLSLVISEFILMILIWRRIDVIREKQANY